MGTSESEEWTILAGGVNEVRRQGDTVTRPAGPHTPAVHAVLHHLRHNGFDAGPEVLGLDPEGGRETLSWVPGEAVEAPLEHFPADRVLMTAGRLLRKMHDASLGFDFKAFSEWYLPPADPIEVICHGDFAPYNCTIIDGTVTGVFDFDTAHPGPRLADVGYAAYRWTPLDQPNGEDVGALTEQRRKLHVFCEAYGVSDPIATVLDHATEGLRRMIDHMTAQASAGNEGFQCHLAEGHHVVYQEAIEHITRHRGELA